MKFSQEAQHIVNDLNKIFQLNVGELIIQRFRAYGTSEDSVIRVFSHKGHEFVFMTEQKTLYFELKEITDDEIFLIILTENKRGCCIADMLAFSE